MIGFPTEAYIVGTAGIWYAVMVVLASFFTIYFFVPSIHRLQVSSIFEVRFSVLYGHTLGNFIYFKRNPLGLAGIVVNSLPSFKIVK